jgi:hypothetical protein
VNPGYRWRISQQAEEWAWALVAVDTDLAVVEGRAPSRKVAAAMLVRAIATGVIAHLETTAPTPRLAA